MCLLNILLYYYGLRDQGSLQNTRVLLLHVFIDLALPIGVLSCWNRFEPFSSIKDKCKHMHERKVSIQNFVDFMVLSF